MKPSRKVFCTSYIIGAMIEKKLKPSKNSYLLTRELLSLESVDW
jgi:hypothetical protein